MKNAEKTDGLDLNGTGNKPEDAIRIIDLFFERLPLYSTAVSYCEDQDCFIGTSASVSPQLIDIWNSRYQIFKAGYKSRDTQVSALEEKLKEAENDLRQYKKHVTKLAERYDIKDRFNRPIEIQYHWFKNLIEWHKEALKGDS